MADYMRGWGSVPPLKIQWTEAELASMRAWDRLIDRETGMEEEDSADEKEEETCKTGI